jgi:hypothetical protein
LRSRFDVSVVFSLPTEAGTYKGNCSQVTPFLEISPRRRQCRLQFVDEDRNVVQLYLVMRREAISCSWTQISFCVAVQLCHTTERREIWRLYARQLSESDVDTAAAASKGMSGRNIRDVAAHAERRHAMRRIQATAAATAAARVAATTSACVGVGVGVESAAVAGDDVVSRLPTLSTYIDAIATRRASSLLGDGDMR